MKIGKRLRQLRLAKGLSQADVEKLSGMSFTSISRLENGRKIPTLGTLAQLARALDLELYQLFFAGDHGPIAPETKPKDPVRLLSPESQKLMRASSRLSAEDQKLLARLARTTARTKGKTSVTGTRES